MEGVGWSGRQSVHPNAVDCYSRCSNRSSRGSRGGGSSETLSGRPEGCHPSTVNQCRPRTPTTHGVVEIKMWRAGRKAIWLIAGSFSEKDDKVVNNCKQEETVDWLKRCFDCANSDFNGMTRSEDCQRQWNDVQFHLGLFRFASLNTFDINLIFFPYYTARTVQLKNSLSTEMFWTRCQWTYLLTLHYVKRLTSCQNETLIIVSVNTHFRVYKQSWRENEATIWFL